MGTTTLFQVPGSCSICSVAEIYGTWAMLPFRPAASFEKVSRGARAHRKVRDHTVRWQLRDREDDRAREDEWFTAGQQDKTVSRLH